jgi:hypothetical protein
MYPFNPFHIKFLKFKTLYEIYLILDSSSESIYFSSKNCHTNLWQ